MMWDLLCSLEGIKDMMIPLIVVVVKMSDTQIRPSVKQKPGFVATTASFLLDESFIYSVSDQNKFNRILSIHEKVKATSQTSVSVSRKSRSLFAL